MPRYDILFQSAIRHVSDRRSRIYDMLRDSVSRLLTFAPRCRVRHHFIEPMKYEEAEIISGLIQTFFGAHLVDVLQQQPDVLTSTRVSTPNEVMSTLARTVPVKIQDTRREEYERRSPKFNSSKHLGQMARDALAAALYRRQRDRTRGSSFFSPLVFEVYLMLLSRLGHDEYTAAECGLKKLRVAHPTSSSCMPKLLEYFHLLELLHMEVAGEWEERATHLGYPPRMMNDPDCPGGHTSILSYPTREIDLLIAENSCSNSIQSSRFYRAGREICHTETAASARGLDEWDVLKAAYMMGECDFFDAYKESLSARGRKRSASHDECRKGSGIGSNCWCCPFRDCMPAKVEHSDQFIFGTRIPTG